MTRRLYQKCFALGLALAALIAVIPNSPALAADKQVKLKLATLAPKGTSYHKLLQAMGEEWKKSGVGLTLYTDGSMGGEADMVRRMRVGQLQAAMVTTVGLAEIDPAVAALQSIPMAYRSLDEVNYIIEKLKPELEKRMLDKGFIVLFWGDGGWVHFFSTQPGVTPTDVKKTKVFAWAGDSGMVKLMKDMGYDAVPLEPTDILTGLQTGLIGTVPTTPFYALAGQFYGPAPNMIPVNWAPLVGAGIVTKKAWEGLTPDQQTAMRKAAVEAGQKITEHSHAEANESVEAMKKRGLVVHDISPEVTAQWAKLAEDTYPLIRGKMIPADVFDRVMELLKEYRAAKPAK
jgi:TRAP-type C4-dicarboxylate transport system substrate-binding protein